MLPLWSARTETRNPEIKSCTPQRLSQPVAPENTLLMEQSPKQAVHLVSCASHKRLPLGGPFLPDSCHTSCSVQDGALFFSNHVATDPFLGLSDLTHKISIIFEKVQSP